MEFAEFAVALEDMAVCAARRRKKLDFFAVQVAQFRTLQIESMRAQGSRSDPCQKCSRVTLGLLNIGKFFFVLHL
jgi:hypothetical protein